MSPDVPPPFRVQSSSESRRPSRPEPEPAPHLNPSRQLRRLLRRVNETTNVAPTSQPRGVAEVDLGGIGAPRPQSPQNFCGRSIRSRSILRETSGCREVADQAVPAPARPARERCSGDRVCRGSGKSSWFKRHNIHPLSSDLLR